MKWLITAILLTIPAHAFCQPTLGEVEAPRVKVWDKDPFAPPSIQAATEGIGRESAPDLSLSAILFSDIHSSAVINGKIYHLGDNISGQKILDIKRTYVIVGSEKKSYRLELKK